MQSVVEGVRVAGVSAAVPESVDEILEGNFREEEDRIRFVKATGIERRRLCQPDQFCSDLAFAAAERLLDELDCDRKEIDAVVLVTQTPDLALPATACLLQDRLGLSQECGAFDVNLGCSGYVYGLHIASTLIAGGGLSKVLLLVGDAAAKPNLPSVFSKVPPLFSDAATATVLEKQEGAAPIHFDLNTDGSGWEAIMERRPNGRPPLEAEKFKLEITTDNEVKINTFYHMNGADVYNFTVKTVPDAVQRTLEFAGFDTEEIDSFVFHQANRMINEFIRKRLKLDPEKVPSTLRDFGNTSSATIPLTMVAGMKEGQVRNDPLRFLLCGFGVGLSWGTAVLETDGIVCPDLVEI